MNHKDISRNIDFSISNKLSSGQSLDDIILYMQGMNIKIKSRKEYKETPIIELLSNWNEIKTPEKYARFFVIHYQKRINDLNWIIENKNKLPILTNDKLFKLLKFKEELKKPLKTRKN